VADIKTLTDKPIHFVVNTHYHFDHTQGNQVFGSDVLIIGSEFTRNQLASNLLQKRTYVSFVDSLPQRFERLKQQAAAETDPQKKTMLQQQLAAQEAWLTGQKDVVVTPNNVTVRDKLTLYRGNREIQILFLGRGHTGGDLVVYLPKEKVVCTGDLMENSIPYGGNSYPLEWISTLDALKGLDFDAVLPGHGAQFTGKEKITVFQEYLRDLWKQAGQLKKQGIPPEDAAKRIDMTAYKRDFPSIQGPGVDPIQVVRIYELMDGKDVI
jgi:cyclase